MSFLGGLTAGGLSLIGGVLGNNASARQAAKQMDFQREMSNTAHQREVADLRAAGLNPILSGTGGSGASAPSGAMASQADVITPAIASALKAYEMAFDVTKTTAETNKLIADKWLTGANINKVNAETTTEDYRPGLIGAQTENTWSERANRHYDAKVKEALWENPDMAKIIRKNFVLDHAIKEGDKDAIQREATKMKYWESIDKSDYGKLIMFLERIVGSIFGGRVSMPRVGGNSYNTNIYR